MLAGILNDGRASLATLLIGAVLMNNPTPAAADDATRATSPVAIVIHGGAGTIRREDLGPEKEAEIRATLKEAATVGFAMMYKGGDSLTAAMTAVMILEDSPLFNAGRGSVYNAQGNHEMDASIMEGKTRQAGAVAAITGVRNPIRLARTVMEESPHVMLMGDGAEEFARLHDIPFEDPAWFDTDFRREQWERVRSQDPNAHAVSESTDQWYSTVGAVALDKHGNLAAATSTGGTTNKRWGRVGDTPIIGAGTYADNRSCAVSATGTGEYFIRATVARDICSRMQFQGKSLSEAASEVIQGELTEMGGDGGIIAIDPAGNIVMEFNTEGMYRAAIGPDGNPRIEIYRDDEGSK